MPSKTLRYLPLLSLVALLSACAGPMPKADPSEAWIGLQEQPNDSMLADKLDGHRLNDGRFFEVRPGNHRLSLSLFVETNGDNNQEDCAASITYPTFKAGEHYTLVESSLGQDYRVKLVDHHGKTVSPSQDFECMSG